MGNYHKKEKRDARNKACDAVHYKDFLLHLQLSTFLRVAKMERGLPRNALPGIEVFSIIHFLFYPFVSLSNYLHCILYATASSNVVSLSPSVEFFTTKLPKSSYAVSQSHLA